MTTAEERVAAIKQAYERMHDTKGGWYYANGRCFVLVDDEAFADLLSAVWDETPFHPTPGELGEDVEDITPDLDRLIKE